VPSLLDYKDAAVEEVFRLEYRHWYNVPADLEEFERWKREEPTAKDDPDNDYWRELRELRRRDVKAVRVRVVDFPISDYLLYEVDFYEGSMEHGECILFVERAPTIDCMQETVVTQDYWLFDRRTVLLWKYDEGGARVGQEELETGVTDYVRLRDGLVERSLPMEEFMARYAESFDAARAALRR
jgi:hypothetical protein